MATQGQRVDITSAEFLKQLDAMVEKQLRDIAAHAIGLDPSPAARTARRKRVFNGDYGFLGYTYFPHHIRGIPSIFQKEFIERFPKLLRAKGGVKEWFIAPRGECKSTLLTKLGPIFIILLGLLQNEDVRKEIDWDQPVPAFMDYGLLLGAETSLPCKLVEVIKTELVANAALALDFPEICGAGTTWRIGEIVTKNGVKVEAFGADQAVRGTFHGASRPTWLFSDDIITDAEAKSPTERKNRWAWITKAISFIGPPDGSVKFLGVNTVLNKDDPVSRAKTTPGHLVHHYRALIQEPTNKELWNECEEIMRNQDEPARRAVAAAGGVLEEVDYPSHKFFLANRAAMEEGAITSWPSERSLYTLMRERISCRAAFNSEMQGDARADEDKVFGNITIWVQSSRDWIIYGGSDPSMGKGESGDPSSIVVSGLDPIARKMHVMFAEIKHRAPSKYEGDLISAQTHFKCRAWGFENNNAYEYMRQGLMTNAMHRGVALPLIGIPATVAKEVRIESMEPFITDTLNPRILLAANLHALRAELDEWPEPQAHHHYDGLDGLQLCWHIACTRGAGASDGYTPATPRHTIAPGQYHHQHDRDDRDDPMHGRRSDGRGAY